MPRSSHSGRELRLASMNAPLPIDRISAEAEAAGAAPRLREIPDNYT